MNSRRRILSVIIVLFLLVPAVAAEEIRFTTESSEYHVSPGEPITIPIQIDSSWNSDVAGTLTTSYSVEKHTGGASILSQKTGMQSFVIFSDMDSFTINAGTEEEEAVLTLSVSFDYYEKAPYHVELDDITVYVENNPSSPSATAGPAESTQSELSSTTSSPSEKNQPGISASPPDSPQEQTVTEENADMPALISQLAEETRHRQENEEKLTAAIFNDSLYREWNHTLRTAGYSYSAPEVLPSSDENGTFQIAWAGLNNSRAIVDGEISLLNITKMNISSTGVPPVPLPLAENASFQAMTGELLSRQLFVTTMNGSVNRTVQHLSYAFRDNREMHIINVTLENGNITSITLEQEDQSPYLIIILIVILSIGLAGVVYRHYAKISDRNTLSAGHFQVPALSPEDYACQAETLWLQGQKKEAFGMLGRALRLMLSQKYGDGGEYTTQELLENEALSHAPSWTSQLLRRCDEIMFGGSIPDDNLWRNAIVEVIKYIHDITIKE